MRKFVIEIFIILSLTSGCSISPQPGMKIGKESEKYLISSSVLVAAYLNEYVLSYVCSYCTLDSGDNGWQEDFIYQIATRNDDESNELFIDIGSVMRMDGALSELYTCLGVNKGEKIIPLIQKKIESNSSFCLDFVSSVVSAQKEDYELNQEDARILAPDINGICETKDQYKDKLMDIVRAIRNKEECDASYFY